MLLMLLAAAAVGDPLNLELSCPGQSYDVETTQGRTNTWDAAGNYHSGNVTVNTPVMRPGTATVSIQGTKATLTYSDGRVRAMENIVADPQRITGAYQRRGLLLTSTWKMEINRLTGGIDVRSGRQIGFTGTCSPAPPPSTEPKF